MFTKLKNIFKFNQDKKQKTSTDNEQLQQKIVQLQQAKDEFLNIAAHDLRTPVTAIRGYTDMILSGDFGDIPVKLQEPLFEVRAASDRMVRMIGDFLTISGIERGKISISPKEIDLVPLLQLQAKLFEQKNSKKNLTFYTDDLPEHLWAKTDPDKIQEIITNLLDNAIKYTDKGSITLKAEAGSHTAIISVSDTGKGINQEYQKNLFEKYYQAVHGQKVVEGKGTGLGLGLYISRLIVEGCGGKIWCESEPGKGSKFSFSLPLVNNRKEKNE